MSEFYKNDGQTPPASITANAQNAGATYKVAGDALCASGLLSENDFRLSPGIGDKNKRLPSFTPDTLQDSHETIANMRDDVSPLGSTQTRHFTSLLACHCKLARAIGRGRINAAEGLGGLALTQEDIGLFLHACGTETTKRAATQIMRLAADTNDKAVLTNLHKDFDGLVCPIAGKTNQSFGRVAQNLWRDGQIETSDPRLDLQTSHIEKHPLYNSPAGHFIEKVSILVRDTLPRIHDIADDPIWGRSAIDDDITNFKLHAGRLRNELHTTETSRMKSHHGMMSSLAAMTERVGLGLAHGKTSPDAATEFFTLSCSADRRAYLYLKRAREHAPRNISPDMRN